MNRLLAGVLAALLGLLIGASWMSATGRLPPSQPPLTKPEP